MGYPPREGIPGRQYHVFTNGVDGCDIFRDEEDFYSFLILLAREIRRSSWSCLSYTLMTTHYHLLIQLSEPTLSSGFQSLNSLYARSFNKRYGRRGALWRRRFKSVLIESEPQLHETHRYIAWNAPKVDLVKRPEDYRWCSYGAAIGLYEPDPLIHEGLLLQAFGRDTAEARRRLRAFVEQGDPRKRRLR